MAVGLCLLVATGYTADSQYMAAAPLEPCTVAIPRAQDGELSSKVAIASQILNDLGQRRARFIRSHDYTELFPTLYYNATQVELKTALGGDSQRANMILDVLIRFYDAFIYNHTLFDQSGPAAVEPHWRNYYERAVAANTRGVSRTGMISLLFAGIRAHLTDLARTLREVRGTPPADDERFRSIFFDLNKSLKDIARAADADLMMARKGMGLLVKLERFFNYGPEYVSRLRAHAWSEAMSGRPLTAASLVPKAAPVTDPTCARSVGQSTAHQRK